MKDSEKKRILEMHYNAMYSQNLLEQQYNSLYVDRCCQPPANGEQINKNHDNTWDYKKVGDKYYTRKKCTEWVEVTGSAKESIKKNVSFGDGMIKNTPGTGSQMEKMPTRGNPRDLGKYAPNNSNYIQNQDNLPSLNRQYQANDIRSSAY